MAHTIIEGRNLRKTFASVTAVSDMSLRIDAGEVVALLGENGAGKSTVLKMLGGVYRPDRGDGEILVDGDSVDLESPRHAQRFGIAMVHQELTDIPARTVAQNVFLGREHRRSGLTGRFGTIDSAALNKAARSLLHRIGADIPVSARLSSLSVAQRQQVEIVKALSTNARVLLMDEPTSALSEEQSDHLLSLIRELRDRGLSVVFTTHRVKEAFQVADRFVVMRDSRGVADVPAKGATFDGVITLMVGRPVEAYYAAPKHQKRSEEPILAVEGLSGGVVDDVSFTLFGGEILGFGGLVGAGRTELARLLFGADHASAGTIVVAGAPKRISSPTDAVAAGLGLVPEDRKGQGLILQMAVRRNIALPSLSRLSRLGVVRNDAVESAAEEQVKRLRIRLRSLGQETRTLSGGNQQKVVLGKWLMLSPRVLILDEPTRGIDVGAKAEIYHLVGELARAGMGIIFISSELPELLAVSDRVAVMARGRIVTILERGEATPELFMRHATGSHDEGAKIPRSTKTAS
jgi:ABC-type sugar transport system ATPase subunit